LVQRISDALFHKDAMCATNNSELESGAVIPIRERKTQRTERTMEIYRPSASMFEPATYRISILGTLDKNWSDYCGGMKIEHDIMLNRYPVTILTGVLTDQAALIGVINSLYDLGCPLLSVECVEAQ
jgi:hypothetical protein